MANCRMQTRRAAKWIAKSRCVVLCFPSEDGATNSIGGTRGGRKKRNAPKHRLEIRPCSGP